jgi:radical SAM-linked protein
MFIDNTPIKQRLHVTFGKLDALVYTSNLDVAKIWERVLRRADIPLLYSEGFNPRPRIALATALPLGISSECELLDVSLREVIALDGMIERLTASSPAGLRVYTIANVPIRSPSLQTRVRSSEYRIHFEDGIDAALLQDRLQTIMGTDTVERERERKGKMVTVNIRPLVHSLSIDTNGDLIAHLAIGEQGNLRPDELLNEMGLGDEFVSVHRFRLHLSDEE